MSRNDSFAVDTAITAGIGIVAFAVLMLILAILSPSFAQTVLYGLFIASPPITVFGGLGLILILVGAVIDVSRGNGGTLTGGTFAVAGIFSIVILGFLVGPFVSSAYMKADMAQSVEEKPLETLPEADADHTRVMPRAVAHKKSSNAMREPRYRLAQSDITYHEGRYYWSRPVQPDGIWNTLTGKQDGAMLVPMNSTSSSPIRINGKFDRGIGMGWWDTAQNAYALNDPMVHRETNTLFTFSDNGMVYNAQSYIEHDWEMRWSPIPMPYAVPEFGGVQLLHQNGSVEKLSAKEAINDERLEGQNFYPYSLAKLKMTSQAYDHGILNTMFGHKDHLVLADVPAPQNSQPFTQFTSGSDHPTYTILAEPYGESTNGIYEVWTIDSQTGEAHVYSPNSTGGLMGPARAADKIKSNRPNANWQSMEVSEIHPVFRNGTLWYKASVVTSSSAYSYTAFVNSETGNVYEYKNDRKVIAFSNGQIDPGQPTTVTEPNDGENESDSQPRDHDGYMIIITNDNGTIVDTVPVEANHSITISTGNQTASAGA